MSRDLQSVLAAGLGELFHASTRGDVIRVRTPFWYPDGGVVDVFVKAREGGFSLTDFGEATGWLRNQSVSIKRSPKQQKLIQDVCLTQGVEFYKGQLMLRCNAPDAIAGHVIRLGQAIVRIADIWFTTRLRAVESTSDEVNDFLEERQISFQRSVKISGRSGRDWTVDFQTRTPDRTAFVAVLATGSRAAARRVTEHVVATWHDLSPFAVGPSSIRFVSLFDDTSDVWEEHDFRLVESISEVCRWSRPDEVERLIRGAA